MNKRPPSLQDFDLEQSLQELFQAPWADPDFAQRLEAGLLRQERCHAPAGRLIARLVELFKSSGSMFAWGAAALLLVALIAWSIDHLPLTPASPLPTTTGDIPAVVATQPPQTDPEPNLTPAPDPENLDKLAYVLEGGVWIKTLPDGQPKQAIPHGLSVSAVQPTRPLWSPSGNILVYQDGAGYFWIYTEDGSGAAQLGSIEYYAWAPYRDTLLVVTASGQLGLIEPHDLLVRKLVDPLEGAVVGRPAWSPDGRSIAFRLQTGAQNQLWIVPLEGGEPVPLPPVEGGVYELAGWTADGSSLLFWQGGPSASLAADGLPLALLDLASSQVTTIAQPVNVDPAFLALNPSGSTLAFVYGGGRATSAGKQLALWLDGRLVEVGPPGLATLFPAWSPDGSRLAFSAMPTLEDGLSQGEELLQALHKRSIYLYDSGPDGSQVVPLTRDDPSYHEERPLWSPKASHMLFARLDEQGQASLWLAPVQDGEPVQVVQTLGPLPDPFGYFGLLTWEQYYDWHRPTSMPAGPVREAEPPRPAPLPAGEITPAQEQPGWLQYLNREAGFSFTFPEDWQLREEPNFIHLSQQDGEDSFSISIGYRQASDPTRIQRTGVGAGEVETIGQVRFLDRSINREVLIYESKVKAVLYNMATEIGAGDLFAERYFTISLDVDPPSGVLSYEQAFLSDQVQAETDRVVESFRLLSRGEPAEESSG